MARARAVEDFAGCDQPREARGVSISNVVIEQRRHEVIHDTFLHSSHHRGQMTVYLRLLEARVPSVYGPSADDRQFR